MLENLLSQIEVNEKKRIFASEYGMIMTTELEGRIQTMCNWSLAIEERGFEKGMEIGMAISMAIGIEKERLEAIRRMIKAGATKGQIVLYGYTEEEFTKAENGLCVGA